MSIVVQVSITRAGGVLKPIGSFQIQNLGEVSGGRTEYRVSGMTDDKGIVWENKIFHRPDAGAWKLIAKAMESI